MSYRLFGIAAAVSLLGGTALAADVYTPPPADQQIYSPAPISSTWTGFYLGGGLGYDWANFKIHQDLYYNSVLQTNDFADRLTSTHIGPSAWFGTVTGGFDWQFSQNALIGVFASYDFQDKSGYRDNPIQFDQSVNDFEGQSWGVSLGNVATIAARAGFLVTPNTLLYGLAGWSWADASLSYFEGCSPNGCVNLDYGRTKTMGGWTIGAGVESKLWQTQAGSLSARLEYRYTDFGSISASGTATDLNTLIEGYTSASVTDQSVRGVLTWRFGGL
jgi:outer membrane immunogenic protein